MNLPKLFFLAFITTIFLAINYCQAKNLGVAGQTYLILEDDFLQLVEARYQAKKENGEWDKLQKAWQRQIVHDADRPRPVYGVTTTISHRVFHFDPSIELSHDIIGLDGQAVAKAGTVINPLEMMTLHKALLFINADDSKQIDWAIKKDKERKGKTKLILVNGSITDTIKKIQKEVYFDQGGKMTTHFKIEHVPAVLQQDGLSLKIEECLP